MQHVKTVKLNSLIEKPISGEWGDEGNFVKVLRSTNFTNDGLLNLSDVVTRNVPVKKVEQKQLRPGDTIIEKSGGSPTQPVGRVVYFDLTDGVYLCSNFTSIIRPKTEVVDRFLFWFLFNQHLAKNTLKYQNKTTGIINLQLTRYLEDSVINLPDLDTQRHIAALLDKADALRQKDRQLLAYYEQMPQAVFLEMFGDPVSNKKGWEVSAAKTLIHDIVAGDSYGGDERPLQENELGVLKVSAVTSGYFRPDEYKAVPVSSIRKAVVKPKIGDLLFSRANTRELVAATCIVDRDYDNVFLPDKLWRIDLDKELANSYYIKMLLSHRRFRDSLTKTATGTSGSMLNVSMEKLKALKMPVPPVDLQNEFAEIVKNIEQQKKLIIAQLATSEALFQSLLHESFA